MHYTRGITLTSIYFFLTQTCEYIQEVIIEFCVLSTEQLDGLSNVTHDFQENGDRPSKRENPHKYLLYKPTYSQLNTFLASGFKELPPNGALLLYISADGCLGNAKHTDDGKL